MNERQTIQTPAKDEPRTSKDLIRLDLTGNRYGPSLAVFEALNSAQRWEGRAGDVSPDQLRRDVASMLGVPPAWVLLGNGIDELLDAIYLFQGDRGPLVVFPPTDPDQERRALILRVPTMNLQRTSSFALSLDLETVADLPPHCWAIVQSPNDPTGTVLEPQDAVRLARVCDLLVVDERHGAYAGRSYLPLLREFTNIVVLQTMETWAGLNSFPLAYAIGPPALLAQIGAHRLRSDLTTGAVIAASATLSDLRHVRATLHLVRQERSRLFRMLRKLNMVSPRPSWANFLLVRVERGSARTIADGLAARSILVHQPPQPGLGGTLRISAGRPEETDALKRALIEIGLDL